MVIVRNHMLDIYYRLRGRFVHGSKFSALLVGQSGRFDSPIEVLFMDALQAHDVRDVPLFERGEELFEALTSDKRTPELQARLHCFDAVIYLAGGERDRKLVELHQLMHCSQMLCVLAIRERGVSPIQFLRESMVGVLGSNWVWASNQGLYWVLKSVEEYNAREMYMVVSDIITVIRLRKINKLRPWAPTLMEEEEKRE